MTFIVTENVPKKTEEYGGLSKGELIKIILKGDF